MEKNRTLTTNEFYLYKKEIDNYCKEIERVRKIVWIKVSIYALIAVLILLIIQLLPSSFVYIKNYGKWIIIIPTFLAGKNLGQNKEIIDVSKLARKEIQNMLIAEDVVRIESCLLDKRFYKNYKWLFLSVSKRFVLVSDKEVEYYILNYPEFEIHQANPALLKIEYMPKSRVVVGYKLLKEEKYVQGADNDLDIDEKIKRIERNTEIVWSYKDLKLPYIYFTYKYKIDVYLVVDVFFSGIPDIVSNIKINITCRKIRDNVQKYLEEFNDFEIDSHYEYIKKIITNTINEEIEDLNILDIEYDIVHKIRDDDRKYINL